MIKKNFSNLPIMKFKPRDICITDSEGKIQFEQKEVYTPETWSDTACKVITRTWFRGQIGSANRETSVYQVASRVATYIASEGYQNQLLTREERDIFRDELIALFLQQKMVFNSPVYFNVGWSDKPRISACFLTHINDDMDSIQEHNSVETVIFRGGGGNGSDLTPLREEGSPLSKGGYSSGPLSFNEGWDRNSGAIKSGGQNRRAARMVTMHINHPDCYRNKEYLDKLPGTPQDVDFIREKAKFEKMKRSLGDAGWDTSFNGIVDYAIPAQNANRSVRIPDAFMYAVEKDDTWDVISPSTGKVVHTYKATEIFDTIAQCAWECGDPGVQFIDTINSWNTTTKGTLRGIEYDDLKINTSNPCLSGDTKLLTKGGWRSIKELSGQEFTLINAEGKEVTSTAWKSGRKEAFKLTLNNGMSITATANHRFSSEGEEVCLKDLEIGRVLDLASPIELKRDSHHNLSEQTLTRCSNFSKIKSIESVGIIDVYDFTEPETHWGNANGIKTHNCSEVIYPFPPVSGAGISCNLACHNIVNYMNDSGIFQEDVFVDAVTKGIVAQDLLVDISEYPNELIAEWTKATRILGMGITNLGSFLMRKGIGYNTKEGRVFASAITALLNAAALNASAKLAEKWGACEAYEANSHSHGIVVVAHKDHLMELVDWLEEYDFGNLREIRQIAYKARDLLDEAIVLINAHGIRNMQVTVMMPCGTTGIILDSESTGIEPVFSIEQFKSLSGGGMLSTKVECAKEGYKTITGKEADESFDFSGVVFKTACGSNSLPPEAHVDMLAAIQPHISGSISKTVNLPFEASVDDVKRVISRAWASGVKCLAIYRDGSKTAQPLSTKKETKEKIPTQLPTSARKKLNKFNTPAIRYKLELGGTEAYLHVGLYEDGNVGEIFLTGHEGNTLSGWMDSYAKAVSLALQYGVPFDVLADKFVGVDFAPSGFSGLLGRISSFPDYIFKLLAEEQRVGYYKRYAKAAYTSIDDDTDYEDEKELESNTAKPITIKEESLCPKCGSIARRTGTCLTCTNCGWGGGCG